MCGQPGPAQKAVPKSPTKLGELMGLTWAYNVRPGASVRVGLYRSDFKRSSPCLYKSSAHAKLYEHVLLIICKVCPGIERDCTVHRENT